MERYHKLKVIFWILASIAVLAITFTTCTITKNIQIDVHREIKVDTCSSH